jgi:hypothetical protein
MRLSQPRTTASESRQHRFESAFKNGVLDLLCDLSLDGSYENRSGKPQWKTAVENRSGKASCALLHECHFCFFLSKGRRQIKVQNSVFEIET